MKIIFSTSALKDYREFEQQDPKIFKRINRLLQSIKKTPFDGIGKPEPLKYKWTGARIFDSPVVAKHDEHAANYAPLCADALRQEELRKNIL